MRQVVRRFSGLGDGGLPTFARPCRERRILPHPAGHGRVLRGVGGAHEWGVARAAAEVAREHVVMVARALRCPTAIETAKPGSCRSRTGCRDGRQAPPAPGATLQSGPESGPRRWTHGLALKLRQKEDAGVERAGARGVRHHDGAGAAIALVCSPPWCPSGRAPRAASRESVRVGGASARTSWPFSQKRNGHQS